MTLTERSHLGSRITDLKGQVADSREELTYTRTAIEPFEYAAGILPDRTLPEVPERGTPEPRGGR